jgi:hypothetical protein
MAKDLKKCVRFAGKLFWVDLVKPDIRVVNSDGTSRPATPKDASLGELLTKGTVESPPANFKP